VELWAPRAWWKSAAQICVNLKSTPTLIDCHCCHNCCAQLETFCGTHLLGLPAQSQRNSLREADRFRLGPSLNLKQRRTRYNRHFFTTGFSFDQKVDIGHRRMQFGEGWRRVQPKFLYILCQGMWGLGVCGC